MPSLEILEVSEAPSFTLDAPATTQCDSPLQGTDEESERESERESDSDKTIEMSEDEEGKVDVGTSTAVVEAPTEAPKPTRNKTAIPPPRRTRRKRTSTTTAASTPTTATTTVATAAAKAQRKVTPGDDKSSRVQQQKKASQLNIKALFHKMAANSSPFAKATCRPTATDKLRTTNLPTAAQSSPPPAASAKQRTTPKEVVEIDVETSSISAQKAEHSMKETSISKTRSLADPHAEEPSSTDKGEKAKEEAASSKKTTKSAEGERESQAKALPGKAFKSTEPSKTDDDPNAECSLVEHMAVAVDGTQQKVEPAPPPPAPKPVEVELPEDRKVLLAKHGDMKKRCHHRSQELVRGARDGLEEELFDMPALEVASVNPEEEFPDVVISNMAILVEGSALPLSELVVLVRSELQECHKKEWPEEAISTKIKMLAERKPYLDNASAFRKDITTKHEDTSLDRLWRWEIAILEVLPSIILPKVRKARSSRRKLLNHYMANQKLSQSLEDADSKIRDLKAETLDTLSAKIDTDEEKVLKYEREAEKQRLALQAKKKKEDELEAKRKEKEIMVEEKRKEKIRKKEETEKKRLEKEQEKQLATGARETEKRKRAEERQRQHQKKKQKIEDKTENLNKQKATFISFFGKSNSKPIATSVNSEKAVSAINQEESTDDTDSNAFGIDHFRSLLNAQESKEICEPIFPDLSSHAKQSRKRRTRRVPISVYVTVMPEETGFFDAQPFAEQKTMHILNKYRFFSFHEDCRPAYHGTWSKTSSIVTGRTPFGKDTSHLDYDYDSEVEWEDGDDEVGEDIDDDTKNQEEEEDEGDAKVYDYDDGFCVADDQYLDIDEDVDDETRALYKKKLQKVNGDDITANRICIMAPASGGIPVSKSLISDRIEGFEKKEAVQLQAAHSGQQLGHDLLWLDAFAPEKLDEVVITPEPAGPYSASAQKDEYTSEEMRVLATFAHHNALNSKEKLVEELRNANPDTFFSRAKATRKLDSIATKKKHPTGLGVYWEVNKDTLEELGLKDVLAKHLPAGCDTKEPKNAPAKNSKKKKVTDAASSKSPASTGKKRKSCDVPSASSQTACKSATKAKAGTSSAKKAKAASPTNEAEQEPPQKVAVATVASANVMMNFLQPRKKSKKTIDKAEASSLSTQKA